MEDSPQEKPPEVELTEEISAEVNTEASAEASAEASVEASAEASAEAEIETRADFEKFRFRWNELPPLTADLPGTLGSIRAEPEDFRVFEEALYLPEGKGSHAYALVEKRGLTTKDLLVALRQAGVPERDVGVAGLKDKYAVTQQWLSVPNRHAEALEALDNVEGVRVLERSRHKNKLGVGHLIGNRFEVRVRNPHPDALARAEAILAVLGTQGVPNYFGPQRFGRYANNAIDGLKLTRGEWVPGGHLLKRFFLSALQSHLFNHMLKRRLERDLYAAMLTGDWAKKHETGGMFLVEDPTVESPRAERLEISPTMPLYGKKVRISTGEAGAIELEVLEYFGLRWQNFTQRKGSRRISRVLLKDVTLSGTEDGFIVGFALPKGSFATSVLREVMKVEVDTHAGDENEDEEAS